MAVWPGRPNAMTVVGTASGANPISIIVFCHRGIGLNASLTGYGDSIVLKGSVLRFEGAAAYFDKITLRD